MRISTDREDPGYIPDAYKYVVRLNGEQVHYWLTADDYRGIVVVLRVDKFHNIMIQNNQAIKDTLTGVVSIMRIHK